MVQGSCCSGPLTLQTLLNYENIPKILHFYKKMLKPNPQNTPLIDTRLQKLNIYTVVLRKLLDIQIYSTC